MLYVKYVDMQHYNLNVAKSMPWPLAEFILNNKYLAQYHPSNCSLLPTVAAVS